jgi:hypothetical protein
MTARHDIDRQLQAFLEDGPLELPDASFDEVRDRTESTRQRVVLGPWRTPDMSKLFAIGLGAAAVVVALVVGARLLGPAPSGPGTAQTTAPSMTAAASPSPDKPSASVAGGLPMGPFTIQDAEAVDNAPRMAVTIPASGWTALPAFGGLSKGEDDDPPQAGVLAWAWPAGTGLYVYGDPCRWQSTAPGTPATTVDEFAAALAAQPSRDASAPVDVTVGGYPGKSITLHVPNDAPTRAEAFKDCDQDTFASYGIQPNEPSRYHQGPGQVDELWIVDVNGALAVIDAMHRADTPTELIEEMRAIAESATFEPPAP